MSFNWQGYGARIPADRSSVRPPEEDDDVQVLDLETGRCKRLLSMRNVSSFLGLPPKTPTYAFHVKLSSDSKLVMVGI